MTSIEPSGRISGVAFVQLDGATDERGRFLETFRQEWFPDAPTMVQANRSDSQAGVLRGLHYHRMQADYWYAPSGRLFVALHDLRVSSPTDGASEWLEIGEGAEIGIYIPAGVAHGFCALSDVTLTYFVDRYYDPSDELGLAWDDPDARIPWPVPQPTLSERDRTNPKRSDIAPELRPA